MNYKYSNGVLRIFNNSGPELLLPMHPEKQRPWVDEAEAVAYINSGYFNVPVAETLEELKTYKLDAINYEFDQAMNTLVAGYPEREISSWPQQEKEARAYLADNTASTPLLNALATARGVDKVLIAQKITQKADQYAQAAGALIGKRQALEDAINAATTVADLEAIQWS